MCELAAQVTSSLLHFPEVTVGALGEDEIRLDSVLHGKFTTGKSGLAWLACGPHLEVVQAATAERFSAYCFSGVSEHSPSVLAARDFCWLKRTGLLVGLEESTGSILCLYDLSVSRVVKAVVIPGRITAIEPLVSYGGASTSTQHLHQSLRWFFGVVAVVTDLGHVLLVDLCLDDPSCSQSELEASDLEVVNKSPTDVPHIRERVTLQGRHLCLQLSAPTGTSATALQYVTRTNQLAVGFSDGYLQLWNMKTLKKEYHSQLEGGRVPVYDFTFQEPENDPRNCCYLWAVQSNQDLEGDVISLHLLQLAFGERKCLALGKVLYEGLEYCEERYSQDLSGSGFPSRAQATKTRLLGCQTIEKFRPHPDRDDSMNEGASPDTSVSIFSWQVKSYGQGRPATYVGLFDINRWYHAQMPDSLRTGESLHNCPYLAVWSLDAMAEMTASCPLLDIMVHERSLSRGLPYTCPLPEQFFNPTTYNFDASCLLNSGIVHMTCSGYQKETLSFLKKSASSLSQTIPDGYSRCLMSGLLAPCLVDVQPSILSQEGQLDAILSAAVETSSLGLITGCIKQWMSEEQPGSAGNLCYILDWAWNKVVLAKEELDGICGPLFDNSSNFTDPQTLQLLQRSQRLLGNLSTIFNCLLNEAHELTHKGLMSLVNKNVVSSLISQYAQVVLWFCRTGLLPEGSDDDLLQISRPFYNYHVIKNYYTGRRDELQRLSRGKWSSDCLMIDGLVGEFADCLGPLWKRDGGETGQYPPPTLHALLDIYLLENLEESAKHAIVIYLLLDVMYSLPNKSAASVESFPTAFAIPIGLVKLVQGMWLLDHHDFENSVELLLNPSTSRSLWAWQHGRVLQALMCQAQHAIALRYLHSTSPLKSSTRQVTLCLSVLLHNRCIVEAWALLRQHSNTLNMEELLRFLYETCLELGLMEELFKLPLGIAEQGYLESFLQGSGGLQNQELLMVQYLQRANYVPALQLNQALRMNLNDPKYKERSNTRNSILDQYGKVLPRVQRKLATERLKPYPHPSTIHKEVSRPQPLSTLPKRSVTENVLSRASFFSSVLTKIGEVWEGKAGRTSPLKRTSGLPLTSSHHLSMDTTEAFVGTPVKMASKRMSSILGLIVRPSVETRHEGLSPQQTPAPPMSTRRMASPGPAPSLKRGGLLGAVKAPELSLLQTPPVVKRARALAASGPSFPAFTPQSILRTSLRPTPVGSPSASPGRSATPPPRPKESRITFIEENKSRDPWSNEIPAENEICLLSSTSATPEPGVEPWSGPPPEEGEEGEEEGEEDALAFVPPPLLLEEDGERGEVGVSESSCSVGDTVGGGEEDAVGADEISSASTPYMDTTMELHEASVSVDPDDKQQGDEEDEVVIVNMKSVAPVVFPLPPNCTGREEQDVALGEQNNVDPDLEQEVEFTPPQQGAEPNLEREVTEPDLQQAEGQFDLGQEVKESVLGQEVGESDLGQEVGESDLGQEAGESDLGQEAGESDLGQEVTQPEQGVVEQVPVKAQADPVLDQEAAEQTPEQEDAGKSSEREEERPSVEPEQNEYSLELRESKPCIGLDEYVERHLFGDELSTPLTRSSIRRASQTWATTSYSECSFDAEEEAAVVTGPAPPVLTMEKSAASVSSGAASDSHSVVSLNDSEELSGASSEEDSDSAADEEDSESDVEIIEEVEGNGSLQQPRDARFFQEEPPLGSEYLQEHAAAVPSLVTAVQLETVEAAGEEEVVHMVDLEAEDRAEPVRFTELRPLDTLLVPLDPEDEQQLGLHNMEDAANPEGPYADGFTLMLEADPLENGLTGTLGNSDNPLVIMRLPQPGEAQLQQQVDGQEVMCIDEVNADSCKTASLPTAQPYDPMTQRSEESAVTEQESRELLLSVDSASHQPEGLMLIESEGPGVPAKESKAANLEDEPEDVMMEDESACLLPAGLIPEVVPPLSGEESESSSVVPLAEPVPVGEDVESAPAVESAPVLEEAEHAAVFEQAGSAVVKEEMQPRLLVEEAECRSVPGMAEPEAVAEQAVTGVVVEEEEPGAVIDEAVTGVVVVEEEEPGAVIDKAVTGVVVEEEEPGAVIDEEVTGVVVVEEEEPGAVIDKAVTRVVVVEEEEPRAVIDKAVTGVVVEEEEPGAVIDEAVTGAAVVEEEEPVAVIDEEVTAVVVEEEEPGAVIDEAVTGVVVVEEEEPGAVLDQAVTGVVVLEEEEPGAVIDKAVTGVVVVEEEEPGAVIDEAETGVVEEEEPGAVIDQAVTDVVVKMVVPVVEEIQPVPEFEEVDSVPLNSAPQLGLDLGLEEAKPCDTSMEVESSVGSKVRFTPAAMHRKTRQRKTITFASPIEEAENSMQSVEKLPHEVDSTMPLPTARFTRHTKHEQNSELLTPRRSRRIGIEPTPQKEHEAIVNDTVNSKTKSSKKPARQNTPPRQGTRRTRNSHLSTEDVPDAEELVETEVLTLPTPRSRGARKTQVDVMEVPVSETEAKGEAHGSTAMMTRRSTRGLSLDTTPAQTVGRGAVPKSSRRTVTRSRAVEQANASLATAEELPPSTFSRRITRGSLATSHLEASKVEENEEHLVLLTPQDGESRTEMASALMERFEDKGAKESRDGETGVSRTTIGRTRKRSTRAPSPPPTTTEAPQGTEELLLDGQGRDLTDDMNSQTVSQARTPRRRTRANTASETDSSPPGDPLLVSPPQTRRKTKGKRAESPPQSDTSQVAPPITRRRRPATSPSSHAVNEESETGAEDVQQQAETAKPRKKKTTRRNAVARTPPPVKIKLISPMVSPELAPGVERKEKGEAPLQRMSLRRKRLLETIFPKPVTRRKML